MAVYTNVSPASLAAFLSEYDLGTAVEMRGIAEGVENTNFLLRTTTGTFILTLYEKRVTPAELPWFLGLMEHLAARRIVCPRPVHARDGVALKELCGRPAAITTFLPGWWPREVTIKHCHAVGAGLAALHLAGSDYTPARRNALGPSAWLPLFESCCGRADEIYNGLSRVIAETLPDILGKWPSRLPAGQIHGDLFPDNVFFLGEELSGLIDFYFSATDLLAYDLAICINAWCFDQNSIFCSKRAAALISGYRKVRSISSSEKAAIPLLCQGAAMRFLLTRLHDWLFTATGALVTRKNPLEFVKRLEFHLRASGPADYGL